MEINHIASGSSGNCITVSDGHSMLVLDAGLPYKKLAREIRFSTVAGVLISHEHQDHCKAGIELQRRGVPVYMSHGTWVNLNVEVVMDTPVFISHLNQIEIGSWVVLPFRLNHDVAEPMGFLFASRKTNDKGVYIIDSGYVEYDFTGITHWLVEANYSEELLASSTDHPALKKRIRANHFSLDDLSTFLKTSDLSGTEEIHLLHLSSRNSDEEAFKAHIQRLTGVPVYSISDTKKSEGVLHGA